MDIIASEAQEHQMGSYGKDVTHEIKFNPPSLPFMAGMIGLLFLTISTFQEANTH